jgi:hypothetical protein
MLLVKVPWANRVMALPFLTLLAPSKRFYANKARDGKRLHEIWLALLQTQEICVVGASRKWLEKVGINFG